MKSRSIKSPPKIEDVAAPEIGRYYLVPCIYARVAFMRLRWWPVIGPLHEDADMSLNGLPVAADGTVVCNGHGLEWNLNTGRMVER